MLIYSGADENFMEWKLGKKLTLLPLLEPLEVSALDGRLLYRVPHHTDPLYVIMDKEHTEQLRNAGSVSPMFPSWVLWSTRITSRWTHPRLVLSLIGLLPPPGNNSNNSWGFLTSTEASSEISFPLLPLYMH